MNKSTIEKMIRERYLLPLGVWFVLYMALFLCLELYEPESVHLIACGLDRRIPCIQAFVYPYLSWFPYICVCAWLAFRNLGREEYRRAVFLLTAGMNVFLLISCVWPTGLDLREGIVYNMAVPSGYLLRLVQTVDAPRSVFPSMHVYVTLVFQYTLEMQSGRLPVRGLRAGRFLAAAIILSTVFTPDSIRFWTYWGRSCCSACWRRGVSADGSASGYGPALRRPERESV